MHLVVIGLNHKTAPIEVREKLSIDEALLPEALSALRKRSGIAECAILSTCNRTEVYAYTRARTDDEAVIAEIGGIRDVSPDTFASHLYSLAGHKAAEHLFRVAAGLDSMVLGEAQILGQVKTAYATAGGLGSSGAVLNTLFQRAITVGKRVRTETEIGRGAFSTGSVAVQLASTIFENLDGRQVLMVGAGKMAGQMVTHLAGSGATSILVANRTMEKAEELASQSGGRAIRFEELPGAFETADIIITSTGAKEPVISRDMVSAAMRARRGRPMFVIDIAVPRDVGKGVEDLDNVFVYNIDDLQSAVQTDVANRQKEVERVEAIVAEEVRSFTDWFRTLDAVPVVTALRERFEGIRSAEVDKLRRRLPDLSPDHLKAVEAATQSIVNRICHHPMIRIKEYAASEDATERLQAICDVFGIPLTCGSTEGKDPEDDQA